MSLGLVRKPGVGMSALGRNSLAWLLVCLVVVASAGACAEKRSPPEPGDAAPAGSGTTSPLVAAPAVPDTGTTSDGDAPKPTFDYPTDGLKRRDDACKDPRAVLLVYPEEDARPITWLKQALLAHPELEVVRGIPSAPMEVRIESSTYGGKHFKRAENGESKDKTALVARCADVATCVRLAAMVRAVIRPSAPELICGEPPAISGQLAPLRSRDLAGGHDDFPRADDGVGQCARLAACVRRVAPEEAKEIEACRKRGAQFRSPCALRSSCQDVATCRRNGSE